MNNSSIDKLAVTPEEIAKIQADIPEMAQELGWTKQEPWMHELGKRIPKWDAAKVGKHSLRAELVRRLSPSYYFEEQQYGFFIGGKNFGEPWCPSPISLIYASERIQSEVLNSEYTHALAWVRYYDGDGAVQLLGNGNMNLLFEYLDASAVAKFIAEICEMPFEGVRGVLTGEIPIPCRGHGAIAVSGAHVFRINPNRLLSQT